MRKIAAKSHHAWQWRHFAVELWHNGLPGEWHIRRHDGEIEICLGRVEIWLIR